MKTLDLQEYRKTESSSSHANTLYKFRIIIKRPFIIPFAILIYHLSIHAQESNVVVNHEGKDFTSLKHAWSAQWITHPTASTLDYGVFLFRNSFDLAGELSRIVIHVSADNRYRLYVNGIPVCFGPAIGDLNHYRYETIDIARFLNQGENVIAAEVVNFGEYRRGAQQTFQTAFIVQGEDSTGASPGINTGTGRWKVIRNSAYTQIPFTSDSVKGYYAAGPGESIDAARHPWGWNSLDFDDSEWLDNRVHTIGFPELIISKGKGTGTSLTGRRSWGIMTGSRPMAGI